MVWLCSRSIAVALVVLFSAGMSASAGFAEARLALVIGNSAYKHATRLDNAVNDSRLMSATLKRQGFDVSEYAEADLKQMKRALQAFAAKVATTGPDTTVLFYYAGHGVQVRGANYLVPIDAEIENENGVEVEALAADNLMQMVANAGTRLNIVILDACRDNPFRGFRSSARGLAQIEAPTGTLVAFSTAPGRKALDGAKGGNSPYTAALATTFAAPGLRIEDVFKRVRQIVSAATDGGQVPWESSSLVGDFYPAGLAAEAVTPGAPIAAISIAAREWQDVKDSASLPALQSYAQRHKDDPVYAALALNRLGALSRAQKAAVAKPTPGGNVGANAPPAEKPQVAIVKAPVKKRLVAAESADGLSPCPAAGALRHGSSCRNSLGKKCTAINGVRICV